MHKLESEFRLKALASMKKKKSESENEVSSGREGITEWPIIVKNNKVKKNSNKKRSLLSIREKVAPIIGPKLPSPHYKDRRSKRRKRVSSSSDDSNYNYNLSSYRSRRRTRSRSRSWSYDSHKKKSKYSYKDSFYESYSKSSKLRESRERDSSPKYKSKERYRDHYNYNNLKSSKSKIKKHKSSRDREFSPTIKSGSSYRRSSYKYSRSSSSESSCRYSPKYLPKIYKCDDVSLDKHSKLRSNSSPNDTFDRNRSRSFTTKEPGEIDDSESQIQIFSDSSITSVQYSEYNSLTASAHFNNSTSSSNFYTPQANITEFYTPSTKMPEMDVQRSSVPQFNTYHAAQSVFPNVNNLSNPPMSFSTPEFTSTPKRVQPEPVQFSLSGQNKVVTSQFTNQLEALSNKRKDCDYRKSLITKDETPIPNKIQRISFNDSSQNDSSIILKDTSSLYDISAESECLEKTEKSFILDSEGVMSPKDKSKVEFYLKQCKKRYGIEYTNVGFVDSHCHIDFLFKKLNYKDTYSKFIEEAHYPSSYQGCVAVFCEPHTFHGRNPLYSKLLSESNIDIVLAIGCHPHSARLYNDAWERKIIQAMQNSRVVAWGECGLDYSDRSRGTPRDVQKEVFIRQVKCAVQLNKPLCLHSRESDRDLIDILKVHVPREYKMHRHCFTESPDFCREFLHTFPNCYIGITNVVHYRTAADVVRTAQEIPLTRLLLETDAPYFLPEGAPRIMKHSHPSMAIQVAEKIAQIKKVPITTVLQHTRQNTYNMYGI